MRFEVKIEKGAFAEASKSSEMPFLGKYLIELKFDSFSKFQRVFSS